VREFETFTSNFRLLPEGQAVGESWREPRLLALDGYLALAIRFAGCTFDNGLYRFHDATSGRRAASWIAAAFPQFTKQACPFGYDWLGRQFSVDLDRMQDGQPLVLMLEPGTGLALEVPYTFRGFHEEFFEEKEAALAASFFAEWAAVNFTLLPLQARDCLGYKVPLFLGGEDDVDNLGVVDLDVYWSMSAQLITTTRGLPPGTSMGQVGSAD
jgi:Domain of unknown function (DUF1851)